MDLEEFEAMEVKPKAKGWYYVTLYQFEKDTPEHADYIRDWLEFDGENWAYEDYDKTCYVCFISKKRDSD